MAHVHVTEHPVESEYLLLTPRFLPPREGGDFQVFATVADLPYIQTQSLQSEILVVDLETRGVSPQLPDFAIVGIGLAWDTGSCYLNWQELQPNDILFIRDLLLQHRGLVAHNVGFDGYILQHVFGTSITWRMCTYALYSMLANEGYAGRTWGLKEAQTKLLLWPETNERDMEEWLITNKFYRGVRRKDETPEVLLEQYRLGKISADKSEMWRVPADILGKYCLLDVESTYALYVGILRPTVQKFQGLQEFAYKYWMHLIHLLIEQKIQGICVDRMGLFKRKKQLLQEIEEMSTQFLQSEPIAGHVQAMEAEWAAEFLAKAPEKFKKDGGLSKNWTKHRAKYQAILDKQNPEYLVNLNSGPQLRELLYNRCGMEASIFTGDGSDRTPSTSVKALRLMGGIASSLVQRSELVKELSYIDKYLELTALEPRIYPSFRAPGTTTGRLSSKEPNLQQVPKSKAVMGLFHAHPGYILVDLDFAALEPTVTTEFTGDPNMEKIYGNEASPYQDFYLFIASSIPGIRERVLAAGYDPDNPTKDGVANTKKVCKADRNVCKTVALACAYGAGVRKVHQTLEEQEIYLDIEQVEAIHSGYWNLFGKVRDYSRHLQRELKSNRGYILNGVSRPMAIPTDFEKDILNRFIQSTGHDVLVIYIYLLSDELNKSGIEWYPSIIDWHDASTIEVLEKDKDIAIACFNRAMDRLNKQLNGSIRLRGTPTWGYTLADVKEPES